MFFDGKIHVILGLSENGPRLKKIDKLAIDDSYIIKTKLGQ
jgi:hypothetical protein